MTVLASLLAFVSQGLCLSQCMHACTCAHNRNNCSWSRTKGMLVPALVLIFVPAPMHVLVHVPAYAVHVYVPVRLYMSTAA